MNEVLKAEGEPRPVGLHDFPERIEKLRLAVRRQAHNLVLVAEFQKAQILRNPAVIQPQGMRKSNRSVDVHARPEAGSPQGARKIPQPVGGEKRGFPKRRTIKSTGEMSKVMFHAVKRRVHFRGISVKCLRERFPDAGELRQHLEAFSGERWHAYGISQFGAETREGIARDSDVIDLCKRQPCFLQAVANGRGGKSCSILHAIEALFLDGRYQLPITHNRGRSVRVIGVDSENVHRWFFGSSSVSQPGTNAAVTRTGGTIR